MIPHRLEAVFFGMGKGITAHGPLYAIGNALGGAAWARVALRKMFS